MANITSVAQQPIFGNQNQWNFGNWLFSSQMPTSPYSGYPALTGLPGYPGQLTPNLSNTILPSVWGSWSGTDPGQQALMSLLGQGMPQSLSDPLNAALSTGGSGYPSTLMRLMAQYGGAGAPANNMSYIMQYGAPTNAVGKPMQQVAQTGGTGAWGNMLQAYALGANTPMQQYLMPFLGAKPYSAPSMGAAPTGGK